MDISKLKITDPKWSAGSKFANSKITYKGKPLTSKLVGNLFMVPRMDKFVGNKEVDAPTYSMGVNFDQGALKAVDEVLEMLGEHVEAGFTAKPVHKDGSIFFKLQHEDNLFKFSSNVDITPDNIEIEQHTTVKVEFEIGGWFLRDDEVKKYGLRLKVVRVLFGEEEKKRRRKKTVSSEEELDVPSVSSGSPSPVKKKKTMSAEDRRILKALNPKTK
jgi:hypothetical protein